MKGKPRGSVRNGVFGRGGDDVRCCYHCVWKGEDFEGELKGICELELSIGRKKTGNRKLNIITP